MQSILGKFITKMQIGGRKVAGCLMNVTYVTVF